MQYKNTKKLSDNKKKILLSIITLLIWMIIIFIFSAMSGDESGALSSGLVHTLLKNIPALAESEIAHLVVRKLAHMTEYAILCLLIINLEKQIGFKIKIKHILIGIFISCIYAVTDEYHQSFVNERSGNNRCRNRHFRSNNCWDSSTYSK